MQSRTPLHLKWLLVERYAGCVELLEDMVEHYHHKPQGAPEWTRHFVIERIRKGLTGEQTSLGLTAAEVKWIVDKTEAATAGKQEEPDEQSVVFFDIDDVLCLGEWFTGSDIVMAFKNGTLNKDPRIWTQAFILLHAKTCGRWMKNSTRNTSSARAGLTCSTEPR